MNTTRFFVIAMLIAMVSVTSAASVDLVHKDGAPDWNEIDSAGLLEYTMPCDTETMDYTFTIVEPNNMTEDTEYCLLFYTRNAESVSWLNSDNEVWNHQGSKVIQCATTDSNGYFAPMTGTFDFGSYGTGLDRIDDGNDYDGSVEGAKVWLVPIDDITSTVDVDAVTGWGNILFETELVSCTGTSMMGVGVNVLMPTIEFTVTPTSYDYGDINRGACSAQDPAGLITLDNTGTTDLQITTITTGIFENIDYSVGSGWVDANNFSTEVDGETQKNISTRICIPSNAGYGAHAGTVTFEYIAVSP